MCPQSTHLRHSGHKSVCRARLSIVSIVSAFSVCCVCHVCLFLQCGLKVWFKLNDAISFHGKIMQSLVTAVSQTKLIIIIKSERHHNVIV